MAMLGRHLLELPPSALEICADWLTASEFLSLRRTSRSALHSGVFSAGCVPRLRCLVRKGEMTGEAVSRLYFPSLKVIVLHASLRELNSIVRNLCCKAAELRNLEVLRLEAPARHHLGDTSVRMLATAMRSWPCLRELGLPINVLRHSSAQLGDAVAASGLARLDLAGAQMTASGWTHLIRQVALAPGRRKIVLGVSSHEPAAALRDLIRSCGAALEVEVAQKECSSPPRCDCLCRLDSGFPRAPMPGRRDARRLFHSEPPQGDVLVRPVARPLGQGNAPARLQRLRRCPRPKLRRCCSIPAAWTTKVGGG
mmetsp:Transcript_131216/g.311208  ORF Transcript_131216/g.311208 Transcript_131216/m.311208 type:complete len:311 (+) Transcript_131216:107-1039(+)